MIEDIRKLWQTASIEVLAMRELDDAKRGLLQAQTAREYADSVCSYREAQIKRLTAYLSKQRQS